MSDVVLIKKNILVIAGGSYVSGAERVTLDVVQGLKGAGHNTFCITSGWTDGNFSSLLNEMNVQYLPLKLGWYYISNLKWSIDSLINYPKSLIRFYRLTRNFDYDFVYTISFRCVLLLFPLLKNKIIYHVHDTHFYDIKSKFFLKLIDGKVIKYIAVSEFIKKDLIKCGIDSNKIEVIYNGTGITNVPINKSTNPETFTVGIVGQIIQRKGHEDAIKALKILKDQQLKVLLVVVGKGEPDFVKNIQALISKYELTSQVIWRSFQNNIHDIYRGIDVVIAPTRDHEPFALIPLEANMLSIPVIATTSGGFLESIVNGINGFLIERNNPLQLAEKISIFYHDRSLIYNMGNNGRLRIIDNFSKEKMIKEINKLIEVL